VSFAPSNQWAVPAPRFVPPQGGFAAPTFAPRAAPAAPRPIVRGVSADQPPAPRAEKPAPLPALPPPEELGIGSPRPSGGEVDWNVVHRKLHDLGALSSQLQKMPEGGYRFTCLLPTRQPDRAQRIEAQGNSEGEAVRLALAKAEQWMK
jgi:hypothetical protein